MFGASADDIFASDVLDASYNAPSTTGTSGISSGSLIDRVFATGSDFVSQFLDFQAAQRLQQEQFKYQLAAQQQAQMLGTTEVPQNVSVQPTPIYVPASSDSFGGIDKKWWLLLAAAAVTYAVVKK